MPNRNLKENFVWDPSCENGDWSPILAPNLEPIHLRAGNGTQHTTQELHQPALALGWAPEPLAARPNLWESIGGLGPALLTRFPEFGSKKGANFLFFIFFELVLENGSYESHQNLSGVGPYHQL